MNAPRDYISGLPNEVLACILELVGTKEAVQSCLLAKSWRKPWTLVPFLKFDLHDFFIDDADVNSEERRMECEHKFEIFVNSVLENRGMSPLDLLQYKFAIYENYSEASLQWLDRAVLLMPRVIVVSVERENEILNFPESLFSCASLQKVELNFITQNRTIICPTLINLPSLKFLELEGAVIDDDFVQKLFSGCPSLESLVLSVCDLTFVDICYLSSNVLKELVLDQCWHAEHLKISCPGLESLNIGCDGQEGGISLVNMVSLTKAKFGFSFTNFDGELNILVGISNVSTLTLLLRDDEFLEILEDNIPSCRTFNNLKSLNIGSWDSSYGFDLVACFIKNSPSLQEITLDLKKCNLEEEPDQEELEEVLFRREFLETIRIKSSGDQDVFVNRVINNFHAHIKNIGKIICS